MWVVFSQCSPPPLAPGSPDREKKLLALIQKQDRLLYLCFYLLLNLAEDVGVEKKMKKKVRPKRRGMRVTSCMLAKDPRAHAFQREAKAS